MSGVDSPLLSALLARQQHISNAVDGMVTAIMEGWVRDTDATVETINQMLAERGLPWRLVKPN